MVFWLIFDDISPGVISCEAMYQLRPPSDSFPGVISFESIRSIRTVQIALVIDPSLGRVGHSFARGHYPSMTLGNLLTVDQILPEMKSTERWSAIVELVDLLVAQKQVKPPDRDVVLAALRQREETMSTGIGFGIAIPHASSDRVEKVVAAFGRSTTGIEFDSLDNAPVRFIVLFVVPKDQFQTHLRTLAAIAKFLNDRAVRERLGSASNAQEILAIFENTAPVKA